MRACRPRLESQSNQLPEQLDGWQDQSRIMSVKELKISCIPYLWHLGVPKLIPQILDGVESNQGGNEEANPFHTCNTSNADTS